MGFNENYIAAFVKNTPSCYNFHMGLFVKNIL